MDTHFDGFPLIMGWELTLKCNLRCTHCGSSAGQARPNELTTREALDVCDQFPDLLVREVDFTGGEPLLRRDWPDIAERLIEHKILVNVLTNGLELEEDTIARMRQVGISSLGISLDGLEATHDQIRNRKGSFAAIMRSVEMVLRANFSLVVITSVNALNLPELPAMADLLRSWGVKVWRPQPLFPSGRACAHTELMIGRREIFQLGQFINSQRRLQQGKLELICADGMEYVDEDRPRDRPWRGCSAGISACGITSDGKVKGCLSLPDEIVEGDLRERSLWDIWFDPDAFAYTRGFLRDRLGKNCRDCPKAMECKGGCSVNSYCSTGQFHNDPLCYFKAEEARVLGVLGSGLDF